MEHESPQIQWSLDELGGGDTNYPVAQKDLFVYTGSNGCDYGFIPDSAISQELIEEFFEVTSHDTIWSGRSRSKEEWTELIYRYLEGRDALQKHDFTKTFTQATNEDCASQLFLEDELRELMLENSPYWQVEDDRLLTVKSGDETSDSPEFDYRQIIAEAKGRTRTFLSESLDLEGSKVSLLCEMASDLYDKLTPEFMSLGVRGLPFIDIPGIIRGFKAGTGWPLNNKTMLNKFDMHPYIVLCDKNQNVDLLTDDEMLDGGGTLSNDRQAEALKSLANNYAEFFRAGGIEIDAQSRPRIANLRQNLILAGMGYSVKNNGVRILDNQHGEALALVHNGLSSHRTYRLTHEEKIWGKHPAVRVVVPLKSRSRYLENT